MDNEDSSTSLTDFEALNKSKRVLTCLIFKILLKY